MWRYKMLGHPLRFMWIFRDKNITKTDRHSHASDEAKVPSTEPSSRFHFSMWSSAGPRAGHVSLLRHSRPALYFEYYERSVWSVFGGLIIDNKYIYICPVSSLSHLWNSNPYQQAPEKVWNEVLTRNVDKTSADWRHATDLICWRWESTN